MRRLPKSEVNEGLRRAQLRWLDGLKHHAGVTLSEIARGADLHPSTLTRFPKPDYTGTLDALTITTLAQRWKFPASAEVRGAPELSGTGEEAEPFIPGNACASLARAVTELIDGRNGATAFRLRTSALRSIGYLPGDVVILDGNATPNPGQAVCATVHDWSNQKVETVWRVYARAGSLAVLLSQEPGNGQALLVDGERVTVKGVVTDSLRPRPPTPTAAAA